MVVCRSESSGQGQRWFFSWSWQRVLLSRRSIKMPRIYSPHCCTPPQWQSFMKGVAMRSRVDRPSPDTGMASADRDVLGLHTEVNPSKGWISECFPVIQIWTSIINYYEEVFVGGDIYYGGPAKMSWVFSTAPPQKHGKRPKLHSGGAQTISYQATLFAIPSLQQTS